MRLYDLDPQEVMNIENDYARPFFEHSDFFVGELQQRFKAAFIEAQVRRVGDDEETAERKINQLWGDGLSIEAFLFKAKNWQSGRIKAIVELYPETEKPHIEYRLLHPEEMFRFKTDVSNNILLNKTLFRFKELLEAFKNVLSRHCDVNSDYAQIWLNEGIRCQVLHFGAEDWHLYTIRFFVGFFPDRSEPQGRAEAAKVKTEVAKAEVLDKAINETLDRIDQE